jgi:hypothetical protein
VEETIRIVRHSSGYDMLSLRGTVHDFKSWKEHVCMCVRMSENAREGIDRPWNERGAPFCVPSVPLAKSNMTAVRVVWGFVTFDSAQ